MESLLLEKLGDNTINDYGDHQRSWLFATASMDSLGVIETVPKKMEHLVKLDLKW